MKRLSDELGAAPTTDAYSEAYTQRQFALKVRSGILVPGLFDLDVLEIGCGHGGITAYMASVGARSVTAIDLNVENLGYAARFAAQTAARFGPSIQLPIRFGIMDAHHMAFRQESFDLVLADNAFEHFVDPESVMRESFRVLRPGGRLLVPSFSSIYSQYGLHLKHGLKVPWANLFFSERTIVEAMKKLAESDPDLYQQLYPGIGDNPRRVRDLRKYKDLNDITYAKFKSMARLTGFRLEWFRPFTTRIGFFVSRLPWLRESILTDVFSQGAAALLRKPG